MTCKDMDPEKLISPKERRLLRQTWSKLQGQTEALAFTTFQRMFESHPEALLPFLHTTAGYSQDPVSEVDNW